MEASEPTLRGLSRHYLRHIRPAALEVAPHAHQMPLEIHALKTAISEGDALNGALAGPARVALGIAEINAADQPHAYVDGISQVVAGLLTTAAGGLGLATCLEKIASGTKLLNTSGDLHGFTSLLGGPLAAPGYLGGAAALVKGTIDLVKGIRHHDRKAQTVGLLKIGAGGLMLAGAITVMPGLVAAGSAAYVTVAVINNRELMSKSEMGASAIVIAGAATCNPILIVGGTLAYLVAAGVHNRKTIALAARAVGDRVFHRRDGNKPELSKPPASGLE